MFVRWQRYISRAQNAQLRKRNAERARLKAILAESIRIEGKPRQRYVAFLGSTCIDGSDRERFWYDVTTRLNRLGKWLSPAERKRIGAAIAGRVGGHLLTKQEQVRFERRRKQVFGGLFSP